MSRIADNIEEREMREGERKKNAVKRRRKREERREEKKQWRGTRQ